jgi:hypothetical protein
MSEYGSGKDYAEVLSGASKGAESSMKGSTEYANTKRGAKESKRRTLANLLEKAMKRDQALQRVGKEHSDEMSDTKAQSIQHMARGFVNAMQGSTRRQK